MERGMSLSTFTSVAVLALILITGLVVDGGAQLSAERRAEVLAAEAARAGTDAAAPYRLVGADGNQAAAAAARDVLSRHRDVASQVEVDASGLLTVRTQITTKPVFLSLVGLNELHGDGSATAELRRRSGT